jgi:hypothetical protein
LFSTRTRIMSFPKSNGGPCFVNIFTVLYNLDFRAFEVRWMDSRVQIEFQKAFLKYIFLNVIYLSLLKTGGYKVVTLRENVNKSQRCWSRSKETINYSTSRYPNKCLVWKISQQDGEYIPFFLSERYVYSLLTSLPLNVAASFTFFWYFVECFLPTLQIPYRLNARLPLAYVMRLQNHNQTRITWLSLTGLNLQNTITVDLWNPFQILRFCTQPPIQWVPWVLSLGVKRPGREANHSSPSSA